MVMTIALTVEMGFLALSFSAALKKQPAHVKGFGACIGPAALLLGGFVSFSMRFVVVMLLSVLHSIKHWYLITKCHF